MLTSRSAGLAFSAGEKTYLAGDNVLLYSPDGREDVRGRKEGWVYMSGCMGVKCSEMQGCNYSVL